jgi:HD-GYP domain-containing protein (c-di-GMP phosphodiesterase class II)
MKVVRVTRQYAKNSYVVFDASSLNVGDTVFADIYIKKNNNYIIIIEEGTILTERLHKILQKEKVLYILEEQQPLMEEIEDKGVLVNCSTLSVRIKRNKNDLKGTLNFLYIVSEKIFDDFTNSKEDKIDLACATSIIESIIFLIRNNKKYLKNVMPLLKNDYHLPIHSLNVALYAIHIGYLSDFTNKELLKLGLAAFLQDVGKKEFASVINKNESLSSEELKHVKEHVKSSIQILKQNNILDSDIINAISQHHERLDGSGYPNELVEKEISDFASILAVCDVFDALTVDKPNRKANSTFESFKIMMKDPSMKNKFDEKYIKLLLL